MKKYIFKKFFRKQRKFSSYFYKLVLFLLVITLIYHAILVSAVPEGPASFSGISNETRSTASALERNESTGGGYIYKQNIVVLQTNNRWKAYVGNISGTLVLADNAGSRIYDWPILSSLSGEVYASREKFGAINWSQIKCANTTIMEDENQNMSHTSPTDNITATFNDTSHVAFDIGTTSITADTCPTTNTYVNNVSASDFEEVVLFDGINDSQNGSIVYATIAESDATGYDSKTYDFQILIPENGSASWTSSTAYYFYVELS